MFASEPYEFVLERERPPPSDERRAPTPARLRAGRTRRSLAGVLRGVGEDREAAPGLRLTCPALYEIMDPTRRQQESRFRTPLRSRRSAPCLPAKASLFHLFEDG
jgi:hypothetical protein